MGGLISGFSRHATETRYLFIDGGHLRSAVTRLAQAMWGVDTVQIDYKALGTGFRKTFYYDCVPGRREGEEDDSFEQRRNRRLAEFESIRRIDCFHVVLGRVAGEPGQGRQKEIDVRIAVDMLSHAMRGNMDRATLLTGDQDFKPLVEALVTAGVNVTIWYDERSASGDASTPPTGDGSSISTVSFISWRRGRSPT